MFQSQQTLDTQLVVQCVGSSLQHGTGWLRQLELFLFRQLLPNAEGCRCSNKGQKYKASDPESQAEQGPVNCTRALSEQ